MMHIRMVYIGMLLQNQILVVVCFDRLMMKQVLVVVCFDGLMMNCGTLNAFHNSHLLDHLRLFDRVHFLFNHQPLVDGLDMVMRFALQNQTLLNWQRSDVLDGWRW